MIITEYAKLSESDAYTDNLIIQICLDSMGLVEEAKKLHNNGGKLKIVCNGDVSLNKQLGNIQLALNLKDEQIKTLTEKVLEFKLKNNRRDILYHYAQTTIMKEVIAQEIRKFFKGAGVQAETGQITMIQESFANRMRDKSTIDHFDISSGTPIAYLRNHYQNYFVKSNSGLISKIINQRGTQLASGEDGSSDSIERHLTTDIDTKEDLKDFKQIAFKILVASELLYPYKNITFFDLWTRYKYKILNKKYADACELLNKRLEYRHASRFIVKPLYNFSQYGDESYMRNAYREKDSVIQHIERYKSFAQEDLVTIFNESLSVQDEVEEKDGKIFYGTTKDALGVASHQERFLALVYAQNALRKFIAYLERMHIDPLSVPSTIFRDRKFLPRFKSFEDYMELHDIKVKLAENEFQGPDLFATNTDVCCALFASQELTIKEINQLVFRNIKDIIAERNEKKRDVWGYSELVGELFVSRVRLNNNLKLRATTCLLQHLIAEQTLFTFVSALGQIKQSFDFGEIVVQKKELIKTELDNYIVKPRKLSDKEKAVELSESYKVKVIKATIAKAIKIVKTNYNTIFQKPDNFWDNVRVIYEKILCERMFSVPANNIEPTKNIIRFLSLQSRLNRKYREIFLSFYNTRNTIEVMTLCTKYDKYFTSKKNIKDVNGMLSIIKDIGAVLCVNSYDTGELDRVYPMFANMVYTKDLEIGINELKLLSSDIKDVLKSNYIENETSSLDNFQKLMEIVNILKTQPTVVNVPKFNALLGRTTMLQGGFLAYRGVPITKNMWSVVYYLHSKGYWITADNSDYRFVAVTVEDIFLN